MSNPETEQLVATIFHQARAEAKKGKRRDPVFEAQREAARRAEEKRHSRFSNIPPGWDGEPWKPWEGE